MVGLSQRSSAKLPNHQKIVSQQDNQKCNEENDCWKVVGLRVMMMMVPTEGIEGKESVVRFRLQKTLKKNKLMVKSWTRDNNDCDGGN